MSLAEQIQTIARHEYRLLRTCARALDQRLEPAVSNSPGLSTALSRVREALRDLDERVSGPYHGPADEQAAPARERASRPAATTPAAPIEVPTEAVKNDDTADDTAEDTTADTAADTAADTTDDAAEVEHLAEEFLEEESEHHTGELAENEDLRDVQARLRAKHAVQEKHEQHDQQG